MNKCTLILVFQVLSLFVFSQDEKTVSLTVIGQGKTIEEAHTNALRSSIEQAFGAFVSSKTEVLNDKLFKDEIVTISNGNVQKYEVISDNVLPNGSYTSTLKATVSISKLTSFCESKGISAEFKGGLFAMNMAIQELNDRNELNAWINTKIVIDKLVNQSFNYEINVSEPIAISNSFNYNVPIEIKVKANQNYNAIVHILLKFLKSICLSDVEKQKYSSQGKPVFKLSTDSGVVYLRTPAVQNQILFLPYEIAAKSVRNFSINNGVDNYTFEDFLKRRISDEDLGYRLKIYGSPDGKQIQQTLRYQKNYMGSPGYNIFFSYIDNGNFWRYENLDLIFGGKQYTFPYYPKDWTNPNHYLNFSEASNLIIKYDDIRSIEEIKKITEYKIISLDLEYPIVRTIFGVSFVDASSLSDTLKNKMNISFNEKGFYVIESNGIAGSAGIRKGDVLVNLEIEGTKITSISDLDFLCGRIDLTSNSKELKITYKRNGKIYNVGLIDDAK